MERNYWAWVSPFYCGAAFAVLWYLCPYQEDGGGPMPTFFCSNCPLPTAGEFQANYWVIWPYFVPYCVAALLLTGLGCGVAPRLGNGTLRTGAVSWLLIVLLAVVVDVGYRAGLWNAGSLVFTWDSWVIYMELKTTLLLAGITAAFAQMRTWIVGKGVGRVRPTP